MTAIQELGGSKPPSGKLRVLLAHTGARDVTAFVRELLDKVSNERFLALTGLARADNNSQRDERQLESKVQNVSRMLREGLRGNKLRVDYQEAIAEFVGFGMSGEEGRIWRDGTAIELEQLLQKKSEWAPDGRLPTSPPPTGVELDSQRAGKTWSLIESLCSIILFGNQDGRTDLDFELAGQPTTITITDETEGLILLQRDVVVKRCIVELNLGGAEIHGGLTALQLAVTSFLKRPDARHLMIDVGGSARAPRLIVQVREGAIGIARPLLGLSSPETGTAQPICYLAEVQPGTKVTALVRIHGAELQDQEPAAQALSRQDGDEGEPAVARGMDRPLAVDDRVRIMMHLWKLAKAAELNSGKHEPGVLTLSCDARTFVERKAW